MPEPPPDPVLRYLPHRPPFVMIDDIWPGEGSTAHSRFAIMPDNVLVRHGHFSESGLVENMAQTAGAATGLDAEKKGSAPTVGYIGAVKDLKVYGLPAVGQTIDTEVTLLQQVMNALIVRGAVHCDGHLMASCELKIFLQQ